MSDLLAEEEIESALKKLPEWELEGKTITRTIEFEEFMEGIDFVNLVAEVVDETQHHPDILIHFNRVTLTLTTHDAGGITDLDLEMAQRVDHLAD